MMQPTSAAAASAESKLGQHAPPPPPLPPQWVAPMQYPAAAMMMAPHMPRPYPQHFLHYPHHHYHHLPPPPPSPSHAAVASSSATDDNKTIWLGDLHYWMDETYLGNCFAHTGEIHNIKVIRNKQTGQSEGYGFVEFKSHTTAENVLQSFNGHLMPNTDQPFRLNWGTFSMGDRRADATFDHSIFVGDLASDVTDALLLDIFAVNKFSSVKGAKVVIDASTGRSKGYGFVRFGDENEKKRAMTDMNGMYCSSRPMRIGAATPRKSSVGYGPNGAVLQGSQMEGDFTNTTVFVGGLDPSMSEDDLRQAFSKYGEIASVKIPAGKQCGFVQFVRRNNAEEALQGLNGSILGKQTVRLSWGHNPANKQFRSPDVASTHWSGGGGGAFYGGAPLYGGYGYALPFQDPVMYPPYSPCYYGSQQQVS